MSARIRITPEMINFLKRKLAGTSDDSPDSVPKIAPTIRTSDIAVTDSLPPVQPQGFSTPDAGYQNAIRPNDLSSPPSVTTSAQMPPADQIQSAPVINKSLFDARAADAPVMPAPSINPAPVISRNPFADTQPSLADRYMATAQPYDESSNAPVIAASRARTTQPVDQMIRASENYNAAMGSQPFFGTDKEGNIKPHADKGFGGRLKAGLKRFGYGMLRGEGILGAGADAVEGAINPDINAQERLQRTQAADAREYGNQIQLAGEQARIGQIRANTDLANQRPGLERERIAQGGQRIEQGNQRLSQAQINSERQAVRATLATKPTLDATRDAELIARARKAGIDVDPANYKGGRPMFIEGVLSDPYTGAPILRDGKQVVDRTKIPVEYDGLTVTPGQAVSARATAAGQVAAQRRFETSQTNEDRRITEKEDRTDRRQQYGDNRRQWEEASKAVSGLDALYRQADRARARANDPNNTRAATDAQTAQDLESDIQTEEERIHRVYGDQFEEVEVPNDSLWGGQTKKQLKLKAAPSMQSAPPISQPAPRGKTLRRMDSSSMDNQVKSHFDKGGKAIKVRDVKTGKETLVDNYSDYLVAIGRK